MSTPPEADDPRRAVRVVVVDDHPFFCEGIATWLGRQDGLEYCGCADSPSAALAAVERHKPDLVLLDLQLRDGDGLELLRAMKAARRELRIIVVSQKDEAIFAERALHNGAHGYVLKAEASDVMLGAIQTVMKGGLHLSPALQRQLRKATPPTAEPPDRLRGLFNRELEVLEHLGRGKATKEIARDLKISPKTVESYRESLKRKLGLPDSLALVRFATLWVEQRRPPS